MRVCQADGRTNEGGLVAYLGKCQFNNGPNAAAEIMDDTSESYRRFPLRIKQCRYGSMLFLETDKYIGGSFLLYGEYCEGEIEIFRQFVRPGCVVIDAGANIGAHTVWFAKTVGPEGRVYAFEPQIHIHNLLCANLALNNVQNVETFQRALGQAEGLVDVPMLNYDEPNNYGGVYDNAAISPVLYKVKLMNIDSINLDRCDFIKIDVEGMEIDSILGADKTLRRCQPILYVENDREDQSEDLIKTIKRHDYKIYYHECMYYREDNFFLETNNIFPGEGSKSLLCMPERFHDTLMLGFNVL